MDQDVLQKVQSNPKFAELVHKKTSLGWTLSVIMLVIYYGFIALLAFSPKTLGTPLAPGMITTLGIPIGVLIILSAFLLTGIYVAKANNEFDALNKQVVEDAQQ
ncbi:DUF485 domain-containing protein [Paludibacterium purpuratum]|uniref:Uncharacterized membrane protein (DUF485 family) n=1 Tax=Paludibacterium purpuratum TaxID=1144873 RepID=A0A4R7BC69_9NEIS|nr:DUF485 domain-containing protein [Paludibacterium purpuratum]TDR82253.1 uncharacterized membrane protein (DUF485 family) [Paludibacterium purpuratum]